MKDGIQARGRLWVKEGKGSRPMTLCGRIHKRGKMHRSVTPLLLDNPVNEFDECR
jgi:hypothetical protein